MPTREHFKTNPGQVHNNQCSVGIKSTISPKKEMRGYVVYLNTDRLDGIVHPGAIEKFRKNPYKRGKHSGALRASPQVMQGLEPYSAKDVRDLISFMRTKDPEHIANSVVVWRGFQVPWRFFMIYYNKSDISRDNNYRFRVLVNSMGDAGQAHLPILMEVVPKKTHTAQDFVEKKWVLSKKVIIEDIDGNKETIVPRIFIDTVHPHVQNGFEEKGARYLVLGVAKVKKGADGDILLDISLQDPRQLAKANLHDIKAENLLNQQRRVAANAVLPGIRLN